MRKHSFDNEDMVVRLSGAVHRRAQQPASKEPLQATDPGTPIRSSSYQHLRHASSSVDSLSSAGDEEEESAVHSGPPTPAPVLPAHSRPSLLRTRLTAEQAEAWQRFPYLERGYRPAGLSHAECVWSLFDPKLHNETFNVGTWHVYSMHQRVTALHCAIWAMLLPD